MKDAIEKTIQNAAADIRAYISLGWNEKAAVAKVRSGSCLGPKSWESVLDKK